MNSELEGYNPVMNIILVLLQILQIVSLTLSTQTLHLIRIMRLVTYKLHGEYTLEKFKSPNFLYVISLCKYFYKMHKVESKCILTFIRQQYYKISCKTLH